jgi:hypothetical protein
LKDTPSTSNEKPLKRPVEARFATTTTLAAWSRSANCTAVGPPSIAASTSRCSLWRAGSVPVRTALSTSFFVSFFVA